MAAAIVGSVLSEGLAAVAARLRESVVQVRAGRGGIGSGVIWRVGAPDSIGVREATVVTNAHVVRAARASEFTLRLADGRELQAQLVATDDGHDIAALTTRGTGLRAAEIGDSHALRVGELVVAVGNPFGREGAVTVGVVAARAPADPEIAVEPAEEVEPGQWRLPRIDLIQADLRLYPGNSGGPLADARGRVVGINAMIGGELAFAIPGWVVRDFLAEVDHERKRAYLGVQVLTSPLPPALRQRLNLPQPSAALVAAVEPGSPAEGAGILPGDALLAIDGYIVLAAEELVRVLNHVSRTAQAHALRVLRAGELISLTLGPELRAAA